MKTLSICPHTKVRYFNGHAISVACGHCEVCLNKKADRQSFYLQSAFNVNKYAYFVTLTYNNENAPFAEIEERYDHKYDIVCRDEKRMSRFGQRLNVFPLSRRQRNYIVNRCQTGSRITFSCPEDVQLFLKRLRKYISKVSDEKIQYYVVSEYGPQHFRIHFHLILFTNSASVAEILPNAVRSCWKFGFTNISLCSGSQSASYVSSYVASVSNMPDVYRVSPKLQPFKSHSVYLGIGFYLQTPKNDIYDDPLNCFLSLPIYSNGTLEFLRCSRSSQHYFFPKIFRFSEVDYSTLLFAYTSFERLSNLFASDKPSDIARSLFIYRSEARNWIGNEVDVVRDFHTHRYISEFLSYIGVAKDSVTWISRVTTVLSTSKSFLSRVCDGNPLSAPYYVRKIVDFYRLKDMDLLNNWYQQQVEYWQYVPEYDTQDYYNHLLGYLTFYDCAVESHNLVPNGLLDNLDKNDLFSDILTLQPSFMGAYISSVNRFNSRSKIKILNDSHGMFAPPN